MVRASTRLHSDGAATATGPDLGTTLARAAEPVLRHLHEQLDGQPISIVLTDANGLVLRRYTGDRKLEHQLDAIMLTLDHDGNKIRAARALGMSRATIYRRIREFGIITSPAG